MNFDRNKPKPSNRSISRENIRRALLNRDEDDYLKIWNMDFCPKKKGGSWGDKRDVEK